MKQTEDLKDVAKQVYLAIAFLKECNYKCAYCHPFGESKITHGQNLSKEELEQAVDVAVDSGFERYRFTGGECTLLPWFGEVLEYALKKDPKVHLNICTNGSTLDRHIELFERYKDRIDLRVSLDSTLEGHRQAGFDKVLTPQLEKSLNELSRRKIPTRFNMVVTQQNKSEVYKIVDLASRFGFDVKLLDLYTQDEYIATHGVTGSKRELIQTDPLEYWQRNYVDLNEFVPTFEKIAQRRIEYYTKDGGFGIPMYAFEINGTKVIFKDSTKGSFYHKDECIKDCKYFGTMCQEGIYTPHVSSNMVLHVNGCHNSKLRWNLRGKTHEEKLQAFDEILSLFTDLQYVSTPPEPIKFYVNNIKRR
jgi:molybdenum cofactor biosynthesis enzyme MoaA